MVIRLLVVHHNQRYEIDESIKECSNRGNLSCVASDLPTQNYAQKDIKGMDSQKVGNSWGSYWGISAS